MFTYNRIIPARAGFTLVTMVSAAAPRDHPRSRGVYRQAGRSSAAVRGSSPLARGLRGPLPGFGRGLRIIPARAGFTTRWAAPTRRAGDHPRSRGVYSTGSSHWRVSSGSSPLARGLRVGGRQAAGGFGIIPARAGFTGP